MSLDELASLTKIPRRSLERLEAGAFDRTPDGFSRGFVRSVAEALGLDRDEAVNRLLGEPREDGAVLRANARYERRQLLLRGGLVAAALVGLLVLWRLTSLGWAHSQNDAPVVYRHDAVRALAGDPEEEPGSR
jgi:cytoskeletal protein RodZ